MSSHHDPEELYEETTIEEMQEWIEYVESCSADLNDWESEFMDNIREQFDERTGQGRKKPLSGNQLQKLYEIYDKL